MDQKQLIEEILSTKEKRCNCNNFTCDSKSGYDMALKVAANIVQNHFSKDQKQKLN